MSGEKQIEDMRKDLVEIFDEEYGKRRIITADFTAIKMSSKGYRKQSEGENIALYPSSAFQCSKCDFEDWDTATADSSRYNFCPNCGAKMKGGE